VGVLTSIFFAFAATSLLTFVVGGFLGWAVHRALHSKRLGPLHTAHMTHHNVLYPPEDYLSETYRSAGGHGGVFLFFPFILIFVIAVCSFIAAIGLPMWVALTFVVEAALISWTNNYLHDQFHVSTHRMWQWAWFRHLSDLHFAHHVDQSTNYGIFWFGWDRVLGTYKRSPYTSTKPPAI